MTSTSRARTCPGHPASIRTPPSQESSRRAISVTSRIRVKVSAATSSPTASAFGMPGSPASNEPDVLPDVEVPNGQM